MNSNGKINQIGKLFKEDFIDFDVKNDTGNNVSVKKISDDEQIYRALCLGVKDYFKK